MGSGILLGAGVSVLVFACGKSSPSPSGPPVATNIITIMPTVGVDPKNIVVPRGSQVTFVNRDSQVHDMESDPHPEHDDCRELESVGFLRPGESRVSQNLNVPRTCGYHDHLNDGNTALHGMIVIE